MQHDNPTSHYEAVEGAADSRPAAWSKFEEAVTKGARVRQPETMCKRHVVAARLEFSGEVASLPSIRILRKPPWIEQEWHLFEFLPGIRVEADRSGDD